MNYNIKEIEPFFYSFATNEEGGFSSSELEIMVGSMDYETAPDFTYEFGATKGVIIPAKKDYVIKIPFNGDYGLSSYWNSFIFGGGELNEDYCALEQELYANIEDKYPQYARFFLPNIFIDLNICYPVYLQEKVSIFNDVEYDSKFFCSRVSRTKVKTYKQGNNRALSLPTEWLGRCLEIFDGDIKELENFCNFLREEHLYEDLHKCNLGYNSKNEPVILDYATYRD